MTRELIIDELKARGYVVQPVEIVKNGMKMNGVTIGTESIRPTIYTDQFKDCDNVDYVVDEIIKIYDNCNKNPITFDMNKLYEWDFVKDKLQLCIQKKSNEDIVKRSFLDLEQYVRIKVGDNGTCKITPPLLEKLGVIKDVLFHAAWDCTKPTLSYTSMAKIMAEMMGMDEKLLEQKMIESGEIQLVLTNTDKSFGAIAMCDTELLAEIAEKYNSDLVILPSSIHKCIVILVDEDINFLELDAMVTQINNNEVDATERLSNHTYRFIRSERKIV